LESDASSAPEAEEQLRLLTEEDPASASEYELRRVLVYHRSQRVDLAQALVVKSSTDLDKAKKIESLQRAVDLLKRSQDLKKRESVGKYLADLEKALQKTKGL
jgi:molybdopterin synthase catalytic subunit